MAFAGIRSFPNEERRTSWRLESIRQLPYSSVLSGLRRRRLSKHQLIRLAFRCFDGTRVGRNYIDKTSELILSACPTEVKKRLNSSATVLSSPLNDLWLVDFLGIHDHLTWSAMDSRSVCLISLLTLRLRLLYFILASRSPVLLADFRQYSLIFISSLTLSIIYRFGWFSNFNFFFWCVFIQDFFEWKIERIMAMFDVVKTVDSRPRDLRNILEKRLMLIILEILIRKVYLPGTLSPKFKNSIN